MVVFLLSGFIHHIDSGSLLGFEKRSLCDATNRPSFLFEFLKLIESIAALALLYDARQFPNRPSSTSLHGENFWYDHSIS